MALCPVAPVASSVPSGRNTAGPSSDEPGSTSVTPVLPAEDQTPLSGSNSSELVPVKASTVRTFPLESSVQPSSSLMSALPVPTGVQVRVLASRRAASLVQQLASMNVPFASVVLCASPIVVQPAGCPIDLHLLVTGL